jgi:Transglutaminase-like enzymes, putative cysteine proteases
MRSSTLKRLLESPRASTLIWVYLSAIVGVLSLVGMAEVLYILVCLSFLSAGLFMDYKQTYPIRRLFLNTFGVAMVLYFGSQLSLDNLVGPLSNLLLVLLGIKFLEEKKPRDMYQILLLSLLCISLATLHNLSLSFLLFLLIFSLLSITSLVFINSYRQSQRDYQRAEVFFYYSKVSLALFISVFLLAIPFFVGLPRSQFPLLDLFGRGEGLKTGIAKEVSLGKVGEIQQDNTIAFRVYGLSQELKDPYWRVQVFDTYQKGRWVNNLKGSQPLPKGTGDVQYTVVLEPHYDDYLPALDYPYSLSSLEGIKAQVFVAPGGVFRASTSINRPIRYTASSVFEPPNWDENIEPYLEVPKDVPKGIRNLAQELSRDARTDEEKLKRVIDHFSKGYSYSLKLERFEGDPLEYFLLVSKKGNCEYYASATALLLRLMDVPARVVGGFKGAIWNNYGNYYIITNSMAHVWVEAYVNGKWVRVDTTPPYQSPALRRISTFSLIKDSIVSFWYSNVVGFSAEKQISLFKAFGKGLRWSVKKENLLVVLKYILLTALGLALLYLPIYLYRRLRKDPENLFRRLQETLNSKDSPERLLEKFKGKEQYRYVEYIVRLYQRYKYSNYRVYPDEVREGYRALKILKDTLNSSRRSSP